MAGKTQQVSGNTQGVAASLPNGLAVLEAFSIESPVLGVTENANRVNLHKSTVSRILNGLTETGYIQRDEQTGRFRPGLGLIMLSGPLLADLDVRRAALPHLADLTSATREASALSVWNGKEAIVVEQVASPHQVKHSAAIGTRYARYEKLIGAHTDGRTSARRGTAPPGGQNQHDRGRQQGTAASGRASGAIEGDRLRGQWRVHHGREIRGLGSGA